MQTTSAAATATLYFARYGVTPYDRERATYEPAAPLAVIQAACVARGTNADLLDVVGFGAGQVHYTGRHVAQRARYAKA